MVKLKPAARANVKGRRSADKERSRPAADAEAEPARAAGPRGGGVHKKKHLMGSKREHALLPRLREEDASGKAEALAAKQRRKRASNSGVLGAVSGMRATLDELLAAGEAKAAAAMAQSSVGLNAKKRLKLVAEETANMMEVMEHPDFVHDPFGALSLHIEATVQQQNSRADEKRAERVERNGGGDGGAGGRGVGRGGAGVGRGGRGGRGIKKSHKAAMARAGAGRSRLKPMRR